MQAISMQSVSSRSTAGLPTRGQRNSRQPSRTVVAAAKGNNAEKQEQQAPNKAVMTAVGAIAAVQLALGGPAFAQDVQDAVPASAESSSARDAVNKETSNAPSLSDIGKNLTQNLFGGGSNPIEEGKDAAKEAANKAKNAAPDLSQGIFDRAQKSIGKISDEASSAPNQFPDALTNLTKGGNGPRQAANQAKVAASDVASKADNAATSAKQGAKNAASNAKNAAPDLSQLPDVGGFVDKLSGKAGGAADQAQGKASGAASSAQGALDQGIGSAKGAARDAQGAAKGAAGDAKNAVSDLSQLPDVGGFVDKLSGKAGGAADQAQGKASGAASSAQGALNQGIGSAKGAARDAQGAAKGAAGDAKNAVSDLSAADLPSADDVKSQADKAAGQAQKLGSDVAAQGSKAGAQAQNAADNAVGQAKNAAPDLSFNPLDLLKGSEPEQAAEDGKKAAAELQSTGGQPFNEKGGEKPSTPDAKKLASDYDQGSESLPVPNVGKDVETSQLN